ncbi:hypothetical protein [Streptomyces parvus]|uniref:hypothetical protein n=1 Tax=Streptomyces parvus TaxID=66428 RepID=UPI0033C338F8
MTKSGASGPKSRARARKERTGTKYTQAVRHAAPTVCKHVFGLQRTEANWLRQPFDHRAGEGLVHRRSQREEAVRGEGEPSSTGSRVEPKHLRTVGPTHVLTDTADREQSRGLNGVLDRIARRQGRAGFVPHRLSDFD